jgi:TolA-binding protein
MPFQNPFRLEPTRPSQNLKANQIQKEIASLEMSIEKLESEISLIDTQMIHTKKEEIEEENIHREGILNTSDIYRTTKLPKRFEQPGNL